MLSNFHNTSERWRTPGTQKDNPLSSKGAGQNIKHENRDKGFRDGDFFWGGSHEGGEVSTQ